MKQLFYMYKVKDAETFYGEIHELAKQKNVTLFNCYVQQEIFTVATANRVQQFDFSNLDDEKAIRLIENAVYILQENIPKFTKLITSTSSI